MIYGHFAAVDVQLKTQIFTTDVTVYSSFLRSSFLNSTVKELSKMIHIYKVIIKIKVVEFFVHCVPRVPKCPLYFLL